jgi:GT2 family glycosyltransferase
LTVWAVIAHYGDAVATTRAVGSLRAGQTAPDVVLVVDNGDDLPPLPGVEVMRPGRNLGFAAAVRAGSLRAAAAGAEWVWVFNNDAEADRECLDRLLAAAEAAPRAALVTPVIAHSCGGGVWYAGGDVRPRSLSTRHWTVVPGDVPYVTGFVTGCAPLVRTEFILQQGPPDHSLFMYYEDVDWCLRALSSGWQLLVVPGAVVAHNVSLVDGRRSFSDLAVYYMVRNRLLLARRWGAVPAAFAGACSWGGRQVGKRRHVRKAAWTTFAVAAGLAHGLTGRRAEAPRYLAAVLG